MLVQDAWDSCSAAQVCAANRAWTPVRSPQQRAHPASNLSVFCHNRVAALSAAAVQPVVSVWLLVASVKTGSRRRESRGAAQKNPNRCPRFDFQTARGNLGDKASRPFSLRRRVRPGHGSRKQYLTDQAVTIFSGIDHLSRAHFSCPSFLKLLVLSSCCAPLWLLGPRSTSSESVSVAPRRIPPSCMDSLQIPGTVPSLNNGAGLSPESPPESPPTGYDAPQAAPHSCSLSLSWHRAHTKSIPSVRVATLPRLMPWPQGSHPIPCIEQLSRRSRNNDRGLSVHPHAIPRG